VLGLVGVVDIVELLVLTHLLELCHLVEILDAAVLYTFDHLVQLLPRHGGNLQPGLLLHTAQMPVVASLEVLVLWEPVDSGHTLGDGEDHLDEELCIAFAGSKSLPDLVFHALDPATQ
jgi:hypothetical protein